MSTCTYYRKILPLSIFDELDDKDRAQLQAHLQACADCRRDLTDLEQLLTRIPAEPILQVEEEQLSVLRQALVQCWPLPAISPKRAQRIFQFQPAPLWQAAFAVILVLLGFMLGRSGVPGVTSEAGLAHLLRADSRIQVQNGAIQPYMGEIDKVKYDPASGLVEIQYQTVNDISYRDNTASPLVQQMLLQAILQGENPSTRLNAVRTIHAMAEKQQELEPELIKALEFLLQKDRNPGVRLMALRVLKSVPMNEEIKNILLRILIYDPSAAIRIQAFETMTGNAAPDEDMTGILRAAKNDSNSFIRYKAGELAKKIENSKPHRSGEISREG